MRLSHALVTTVLLVGLVFPQTASKNSTETIAGKTAGMTAYPGFFNFYWDESSGKIWLEIDKWDEEFLYMTGLQAGIGSNDIGLDRGDINSNRVVKFQKIGPKVLLIQPNYSYRAVSDNRAERNSVAEAFAQSVLWGFEQSIEENGRVLVDATSFFLQDAAGVSRTLQRMKEGNYSIDQSRSAIFIERTKNFPDNSEFEALLTFKGTPGGQHLPQVTPTATAVTVRQHHSFIRLPDDGYQPRKSDPRAGYFGTSYLDYAVPISQEIRQQFIACHRLIKKTPGAAPSEVVEPIVYYVDNGAPEPILSALLDGARWWEEAFEAAGFINAFRVEVLPEGIDPMDVRYNVIQWVHRSTRGWSYGNAVSDPRTGEIIKGHVSLGSLRVRQDFLIAEGLLSPHTTKGELSGKMEEMALARLRQLSAHEVGHTLGITHNFAASVNDRASVMDYPHPLVKLNNAGEIDLSEAYAVGIGEWDKRAVLYGYAEFDAAADEDSELNKILLESDRMGLHFIADADARPTGGAHPLAHLWDNGANSADELNRVMAVRKTALENFSEAAIPHGEPMSTLEEVLVPIYFFHRYQLEGAAKLIGGLQYTYAMRGDGQPPTEIVAPNQQKMALEALLATVTPEALQLPETLLKTIPPRPFRLYRNREVIRIRTGVTFDPLAAAETAAHLTMRMIFHPERMARLVEYHSRNKQYPSAQGVIETVLDKTVRKKLKDGYHGEIQRAVNYVTVYNLIHLAANPNASSGTRAIVNLELAGLRTWLQQRGNRSNDDKRSHYRYLESLIRNYFAGEQHIDALPSPPSPPAGSPIGSGVEHQFCSFR